MENRLVLYSVAPRAAGVPGSCPRDESRLAEEARGQRDPNLRPGGSGDGPESTRFPEARSRGSGGGPGARADALGVRCALRDSPRVAAGPARWARGPAGPRGPAPTSLWPGGHWIRLACPFARSCTPAGLGQRGRRGRAGLGGGSPSPLKLSPRTEGRLVPRRHFLFSSYPRPASRRSCPGNTLKFPTRIFYLSFGF